MPLHTQQNTVYGTTILMQKICQQDLVYLKSDKRNQDITRWEGYGEYTSQDLVINLKEGSKLCGYTLVPHNCRIPPPIP
jgi:hypothetical protein